MSVVESVVYDEGPWRIEWRGGRLAEVYHLESDAALDAFEVGDFDWSAGPFSNGQRAPHTLETLEPAAREWLREHADETTRHAFF
jgi:hypothetical protein